MDIEPPHLTIREIEEWLLEDAQYGDITSEVIIPSTSTTKALVRARNEGVIAGIPIITQILDYLKIDYSIHVNDGEKVEKNDQVLSLSANTRQVLLIERLILNILTHLSGIATQVSKMMEIIHSQGGTAKIAATRKTLPGLRKYQKYAVRVAGGLTHRYNLSDCILIKDNHIHSAGSIKKALQLALEKRDFTKRINIEVESHDDAIIAAETGADILMLDNMNPNEIEKVHLSLVEKQIRNQLILEISGGISPENLIKYAALPVNVISMGSLTHSVVALDLGLDFC